MLKKVCVAIPIYQKITKSDEILSLKRALEIFQNYPIIFICPQSFNILSLEDYKASHRQISFQRFSDDRFKSVKSYSALLISSEFYKRFSDYEFLLIYQTDAYVFSDQLDHWCNSGIDYIGAPWFKKFDTSGKNKDFIPVAGNGGFSLRNISKINLLLQRKLNWIQKVKFLHLMKKTRFHPHHEFRFYFNIFIKNKTFADICDYTIQNSECTNEDYFFAFIYSKMFTDFRSSNASEAISFAFESQPETLYKLNGEKLPFGCHAWMKYSPNFWKKFINF